MRKVGVIEDKLFKNFTYYLLEDHSSACPNLKIDDKNVTSSPEPKRLKKRDKFRESKVILSF